jgi:predicted PurR-regulated permease PerM
MTLYFFVGGQTDRAWLCLVVAFPLVVGVPDLIIRPLLARSQGKINALTMMIGFMAGIEAFGPAGFVLGPLILELFVCFTGMMLDRRSSGSADRQSPHSTA